NTISQGIQKYFNWLIKKERALRDYVAQTNNLLCRVLGDEY
ncbi:31819_t:CDS:1, partial [Racocetra persica]